MACRSSGGQGGAPRRSSRGGVAAIFLTYNAAYYLPWGGQAPGPRFLVPALPFLALPLAMALRSRPLVVAGVGTVSVAVMTLATITDPLTGEEHGIAAWWTLARDSDLVDTIVDARRCRPGLGWEPCPSCSGSRSRVALGLSLLPLRARLRAEGPLLAGAIGAWALLAAVAPNLLPADEGHGSAEGTVAVLLLSALIAAALALALRYGPVVFVPALPALLLATPMFDDRPRLALLGIAAVAAVAVVVWALRRGAWRSPPGLNSGGEGIPTG